MFPVRMFPVRMFAPRYFPPGVVVEVEAGGHSRASRDHWGDRLERDRIEKAWRQRQERLRDGGQLPAPPPDRAPDLDRATREKPRRARRGATRPGHVQIDVDGLIATQQARSAQLALAAEKAAKAKAKAAREEEEIEQALLLAMMMAEEDEF